MLTWSKLYHEVLIRKMQKKLKLVKNPDSGRYRNILQPHIRLGKKWVKNSTFVASIHQNLTPVDGFYPKLGVLPLKPLKFAIFVKSLNFLFDVTPQTVNRAVKRP